MQRLWGSQDPYMGCPGPPQGCVVPPLSHVPISPPGQCRMTPTPLFGYFIFKPRGRHRHRAGKSDPPDPPHREAV